MTTIIYKYEFGDTEAEIEVPEGWVRHVAVQYPFQPTPTVWVEHQLPIPDEKMRLRLFGTGHAINGPSGWWFVGSAVCANGELVWHVHRSPVPPGQAVPL